MRVADERSMARGSQDVLCVLCHRLPLLRVPQRVCSRRAGNFAAHHA